MHDGREVSRDSQGLRAQFLEQGMACHFSIHDLGLCFVKCLRFLHERAVVPPESLPPFREMNAL